MVACPHMWDFTSFVSTDILQFPKISPSYNVTFFKKQFAGINKGNKLLLYFP